MLATEAVAAQIVANQISSALRRSAEQALWQRVTAGTVAGTYAVPSQSRDGLTHLVTVRPRRFAGEPAHQCYSCSCEARNRAGCVHRAAVYQSLAFARFGSVPTSIAAPAPAPTPVPERQREAMDDAQADRQADAALAWLHSRERRPMVTAPRRVDL